MGGVCSAMQGMEDQQAAAALRKERRKRKQADSNRVKVLLLGPGESGKSTVFRQMKLFYTQGFTSADRVSFRNVIRANMLESIQTLLAATRRFQIKTSSIENQFVSEILPLQYHEIPSKLDLIRRCIQQLWGIDVTEPISESLREAYAIRNRFYLPDATS